MTWTSLDELVRELGLSAAPEDVNSILAELEQRRALMRARLERDGHSHGELHDNVQYDDAIRFVREGLALTAYDGAVRLSLRSWQSTEIVRSITNEASRRTQIADVRRHYALPRISSAFLGLLFTTFFTLSSTIQSNPVFAGIARGWLTPKFSIFMREESLQSSRCFGKFGAANVEALSRITLEQAQFVVTQVVNAKRAVGSPLASAEEAVQRAREGMRSDSDLLCVANVYNTIGILDRIASRRLASLFLGGAACSALAFAIVWWRERSVHQWLSELRTARGAQIVCGRLHHERLIEVRCRDIEDAVARKNLPRWRMIVVGSSLPREFQHEAALTVIHTLLMYDAITFRGNPSLDPVFKLSALDRP
jgi:hypothetical protein